MDVGSGNKNIGFERLLAVAILLATASFYLHAQETVFDTPVTIRMNNVKVSSVLKSITRKTGFEFTYDTDLVLPDSIVNISAIDSPVREVLDDMFRQRELSYTTIGKHIIIYLEPGRNTNVIEEEGREPVYLVSGWVIEKESGQPLPYATLGIYGKGKGTVSNFDGGFSLKVNAADLADSLRISYLGFKNMIIPVNTIIGSNYRIELERDYVPIPEVIIRSREPIELIRNIRLNIPANYGTTPSMLSAFYRESISRKSKLQEYSEAIINIYKSPYARSFQTDQVSLFKSRKIVNTEITDTLIVKLKAGLSSCLALDGIRNTFDFIAEENLGDYNYRMVDIISFDEEAAFVIEFSQKDYITDIPLFNGLIYINTDNYGVHSAEFEINPKHIDKIDNQFVPQSAKDYTVKVRKVKYKVDYRYLNGRYYLNHVRGDIELFARKKRSLFGSPYYIFFELATTSIDTVNVSRFNRNETFPTRNIFSEIITGYDPDFWGTDNFVKPEDDIQEAINRINAKIGKFEQEF